MTLIHERPAPGAPAASKPETLTVMALAATTRPDGTALRLPVGDGWQDMSWQALGERMRAIGKGLLSLGIERGDRVAILSSTRAEWTWADLGTLSAGATTVPIYPTNSPEECEYVLAHSEATACFVEDAAQAAKIAEVRGRLPALEHVISFGSAALGAIALDDLVARGRSVSDAALEAAALAVEPDDLCTIVYTSGTTGPPKGCMLTHANVRANLDMLGAEMEFGPDDVVYVFLPLAHVLTRVTQLFAIDCGATLAYWRGDMTGVLDDIAAIRPTLLPAVPRVFEKIHARAMRSAEEGSAVKAAIMRRALATGARARAAERGARPLSPLGEIQHGLSDRLVLSKVRDLFGGRLRYAVTGAAPIAPRILEFFDACGVTVLEGYGMTETSAACTLNRPDDFRWGTVGKPLAGAEVSIAPDGEILMRGPHIFQGYHRDEAATQAALRDGWMHSGDLGEIDADGFVKITGRKKDIIITSSGKNITPANIENRLKESPWVAHAVVIGDNRPYLVALLTLDATEAPALAATLGLPDDDPARLAVDPAVHAELDAWVQEVNAHFARIEQVKPFGGRFGASVEQDHDRPAARRKPLRPFLAPRPDTERDRAGGEAHGPSRERIQLALHEQRPAVGGLGLGEQRVGAVLGAAPGPAAHVLAGRRDARLHVDDLRPTPQGKEEGAVRGRPPEPVPARDREGNAPRREPVAGLLARLPAERTAGSRHVGQRLAPARPPS